MAFEKLTNNLKGLTDNGQEYAKVTADYYKLSLFRNGMKAVVNATNVTLKATFAIIAAMFFSIGFAILIGELLESPSVGFFIVGGFYLILFLLVIVFAGKSIEKMLLKKYSKIAFSDDALSDEDIVVSNQNNSDESI